MVPHPPIALPRWSFQRRSLIHVVLILWSAICVFPLYWVAITSLKGDADVMSGPFYIPFVDFMPSLAPWVAILDDANDHLLMRFFNSSAIALSSTALTLLLSAMAVYGLSRFPAERKFGNDRILFVILATRILPPIVVALPIYFMAQYTGTLDSYCVLIFTYTAANLPVAIWLILPVFGARATQQEEAAQLDGASHLRVFFTIFLPMVATSMAAIGLLIFTLCWNEYLFAAYLAGDHVTTLPPWMMGQMSIKEAQTGGDGEEWAQLSAATIFMVAPVLACSGFAQRILGRMALWKE
jgi:multiple sugar transport system permease protein